MSKPLRTCLPSYERESYISFLRKNDYSFVTERQSNRYIDDFLRFCQDEFKHAEAQKVAQKHVIAYAKRLTIQEGNYQTARVKLLVVLKWLRWLASKERIGADPTADLIAAQMVATLKPNLEAERLARRKRLGL